MTVKVLLEALLIDWVRRNMRRGERVTPSGARIRGRVSRNAATARWNWWVEMWIDPPPPGEAADDFHWALLSGWSRQVRGDTLTRLGAHARVRVALRAYEHGTELVR